MPEGEGGSRRCGWEGRASGGFLYPDCARIRYAETVDHSAATKKKPCKPWCANTHLVSDHRERPRVSLLSPSASLGGLQSSVAPQRSAVLEITLRTGSQRARLPCPKRQVCKWPHGLRWRLWPIAAVARDVLRHVARPATAAEHTPQQLTQRARVSGSAGSWLHCLSGSPCVARSWASRGWLQTCMYDLADIVFCRHMLITSSTAAPDFCLIIYRRLPLISCGEHPLSTPSWGRCLVHVGAAAEPDGNRDVGAGNGRQRQTAAGSSTARLPARALCSVPDILNTGTVPQAAPYKHCSLLPCPSLSSRNRTRKISQQDFRILSDTD